MKVQRIIEEYAAGRPHFGGVILDVEHYPQPAGGELLVGFGQYVAPDATYQPAVREGAAYFFGLYSAAHPGDLLVEALGIHELPGDTTAPVVQYATILALAEALSFPIEGLAFDWETGALHHAAEEP